MEWQGVVLFTLLIVFIVMYYRQYRKAEKAKASDQLGFTGCIEVISDCGCWKTTYSVCEGKKTIKTIECIKDTEIK